METHLAGCSCFQCWKAEPTLPLRGDDEQSISRPLGSARRDASSLVDVIFASRSPSRSRSPKCVPSQPSSFWEALHAIEEAPVPRWADAADVHVLEVAEESDAASQPPHQAPVVDEEAPVVDEEVPPQAPVVDEEGIAAAQIEIESDEEGIAATEIDSESEHPAEHSTVSSNGSRHDAESDATSDGDGDGEPAQPAASLLTLWQLGAALPYVEISASQEERDRLAFLRWDALSRKRAVERDRERRASEISARMEDMVMEDHIRAQKVLASGMLITFSLGDGLAADMDADVQDRLVSVMSKTDSPVYVGSTVSPSWRWQGGTTERGPMMGHHAKYSGMTVVAIRRSTEIAALETMLIKFACARWGDATKLDNKARDGRGFSSKSSPYGYVYVCYY